MPRPKKQRHLSPRDRLLITAFLEYHKSRALTGVDSSTHAMEACPTSKQFQGMAAHFTKMVQVCDDMLASLPNRQEWLPYFQAALIELELPT